MRFRNHSGIDIPSLARVAVKTLLLQNTSQGGGSTITQQLAKNLFPRDTARNRGRIARTAKLVTSKFKEWITALKLEYNYTKEEIAAMYLNTVEYVSCLLYTSQTGKMRPPDCRRSRIFRILSLIHI